MNFLSHLGSDCGIANINIGTSGAGKLEVHLVVKRTGAVVVKAEVMLGRLYGRQTNTINWDKNLPLAQGKLNLIFEPKR
ncbi:MAG: hypothetical protein IPN09_08365 [Bacteroidetes bacterium]|nr:hypothetical protein [Bacteroidota bacterium]